MFAIFIFVFTILVLSHAENITSLPSDQEFNYCILPAYPEHGTYTILNNPSATPGQRHLYVKLEISCDTGYIYNSTNKSMFCINGEWSAPIHTCVRDLRGFCSLPTEDLSVMYRCLSSTETRERFRECESLVPTGTLVMPVCSPAYFSVTELSDMQCRNGTWDYKPICKPACGLTTQHLQLEGTFYNHLELPWNVVIYEKRAYQHICDGSLITATKIISAARCFYDNYLKQTRPASDFKVAVNKMYSDYNNTRDRNSQYSDVNEIIIPSSYRDHETKYEDDIAIVVVKRPFFFHLSVRPVCLDFDNDLDSTQLVQGNSGKTVGWIAFINNDDACDVVYVIDLKHEDCNTIMKNKDCKTFLSTYNRQFLTKDKFCAKEKNESDEGLAYYNGGGLAFLESTTQRYYLRGVRSGCLGPVVDDFSCIFTSIMKQEHFIKQHL